MVMRRLARPGTRDRGSALIEVVIFLPVLLMSLLAGIQLFFVAASDLSAQNAARAGARAASKGSNGEGAAYDSVAGFLRGRTEVWVINDSDGVTVRVTVQVPRVFPALPSSVLVRGHKAVMPLEDSEWG